MRILHLCNDYFYSNIYRNLHRNLLSKNMDSLMVVPSNNNEIDRPKEEKVIQVKCFNKMDKYFYFIKQSKVLNTFKNYVNKFKPDILHAHFVFSSGCACMKIKQEYNIPYIVAVRNTDVNLFFKRMVHLRRVGIQIMLNADKVVFISPSYRDMVISKYIPIKYREYIVKKSVILPNGIDEFWHANTLVQDKKSKGKKVNLISVGAINENKNQLTVAKAAEILTSKGYQISYSVVGNIEDKNIYNELSKYDFIRYVESQPKESLIDYYREADILVMPSITETFGLVYAEAMSQGLPVIYSKGQGFDGQFKEGVVGFAVTSFDVKEIAYRIVNAMNNHEEISKKCVVESKTFDWVSISDKYIQIYNKITKV